MLKDIVSLLTLLIIAAFLGLAIGTFLVGTGPLWLIAVYGIAAILATSLRHGVEEIFTYMLERDGLMGAAFELERILAEETTSSVRVIAMGHNHRPAIERLDDAWYVNTGAWVPLYEKERPVEGREALTFLRLVWENEGTPELLRWDDAGGAPTRLVLWDDAVGR